MADSVQEMAPASDPSAVLHMALEWKGMGESMVKSLVDCVSGMESREKNRRLVSESLAKRSRDLEEGERELEKLKALQEGRSEELRLREEKLDEQLRLVNEHIEGLEASQGEVEDLRRKEREKLKEIEKKNRELDVVRGLLERQLDEVGKRLNEFDVFCNGKLQDLSMKEELLCKEKREFAEEVKLANEKLKEKQRLGHGLIERLESALDMLGGMKMIMDERFKEIESRETMAHKSLTSMLNEADSIRESLEKRFKELEDFEKDLNFFQEGKTRKLVSKEQLPDVTYAGKGWTQVNAVAGEGEKECRLREVESESKLHDVHFKEGSEQAMLTDTTDGHLTIKPYKSADLGYALQKDRKTLEMLIYDHEKDLELMDDEIYNILMLSTDPAKLVVDTVQGFYALPSGKLDIKCKVWRATILLLDQLTKMSPKIQPCVAAAAVELAFEWKSKLSAMIEDPMEVLGFLHLLAAFHLSSNFDKNELFSFLKVVGQHKQAPELCHILGLTAKIPGYIQKLINRKKYLLASSYTYEYQLQHKFKQSTILSYYVEYSKFSANTKVRRERNSYEARDKCIASEIADLRAGVAHIIKYGLESEYSPNVLTARIQQLEASRASLRHGCPSSTPTPTPTPSCPPDNGIQKQGNKRKGSGYPNKWKARRKFRRVAPNPQMPCIDGSNSWTAQHQLCNNNTEMYHGASPAGFSYPWAHVNVVPHHPQGQMPNLT